jgi:very-short-patch-repair endonuclease
MSRAVANARDLRRRQTEAERRLWARLRGRKLGGFKFRRQRPVGPFVADFVCHEAALVVELDGGQHAERAADDEARSRYLAQRGYRVLRFWNHEALADTEAVLRAIEFAIAEGEGE